MEKNFALLDNLEENLKAIKDIDDSVKITLGPTGKNGIVTIFDTNKKLELKVQNHNLASNKHLNIY